MAYFPNMTAWEYWAADNCFKCLHWPKDDDAPGCPVDMAHALYSYELCNAEGTPGKTILDMLIPETADGLGAEQCAMFHRRDGFSERQITDWAKYKAAMEEAAQSPPPASNTTRQSESVG